MFSGSKKFFASQALVSSALCCSLLLSSVALAGPRDRDDNSGTKSGNAEVTRKRIIGITGTGNNLTAKAVGVANASTIRNVSIAKSSAGVLAVIELDGQAKFNHFTLPSPYRLVVDVQNVSNTAPPVIEVGEHGIKRVRVGKMDDVVRIVFDADKQQKYQIAGEGTQIRIAFGEADFATAAMAAPPPATTSSSALPKTQVASASATAANKRDVKPTPMPVTKVEEAKTNIATNVASAATTPAAKTKAAATNAKPTVAPLAENLPPVLPQAGAPIAKAVKPQPQANAFVNKNLVARNDKINDVPPPPKPAPTPAVVPNVGSKLAKKANTETIAPVVKATPVPMPAAPPAPAPRPRETTQPQGNIQGTKIFKASDYERADFQGEPINLDLRSSAAKTVDIRDFLRFISDTYKVNFVLDQSVKDVPITVTLQGIPWNKAMNSILKANRLGVKVDGDILRVLSQDAITQEDTILQQQMEARDKATPLVTETVRLKFALAGGGAAGGGGGGAAPAAGGGGGGGGGGAGGGGLDTIIKSRLSSRGSIMPDQRTNMLIITDLPKNIAEVKKIIAELDVPEPQVEIEARIVIANRNFARELGVQLGANAVNNGQGSTTAVGTSPTTVNSTGTGIISSVTSAITGGANFALGLTTGRIGSSQINAILTAQESKGNVKTISTPRITAQNNQMANIVNGVQIPVQTESNNTLTITFVTAALKLEITPRISDSGYVNLKVVAENNSVNTALATSAAPGINTQKAETTVLVPDGGTTIIGGINIDVESNSQQRTPGLSAIPGLGELFKKRSVSRQTDEILFFITPRIFRPMIPQ